MLNRRVKKGGSKVQITMTDVAQARLYACASAAPNSAQAVAHHDEREFFPEARAASGPSRSVNVSFEF